MVMSKLGIRKFLKRKLRDSAKAKRFSERALDEKMAREGLDFLTEPRHAQKVCTLLGLKYPSYFFLLGMGGGKTKITLDLFSNRRAADEVRRCLVLVPNVVNLNEWELQVETHAHDCTVQSLDVHGEVRRREILEGNTEIVVSTYAGMAKLCSKKGMRKKGRRLVPGWIFNRTATDRIACLFDMLILDESTSVMNHTSLFFRMVRRMRKTIGYCYALTGTPIDKDPMAFWSQFFLIDGGYALGETLGLFREVFFRKTVNYWGGYDYEFRKKMMPELARRLRHCSVRYSEEECQDLPPSVGGLAGQPMLVPVDLPPEQRPFYKAISTELQDSRGNYDLVNNAYTRMRIVCSGWLGAKTEDGERVELVFKRNPKLDALIVKLREIDEKVVVVHWFNTSGKIIAARLKAEKISFVWVYGGTSTKAKRERLDQFRDPKGPKVLLASTAISKGVNLQAAARFMMFFERPDSVIDNKQLEARICREGGLEGHRYYYDIIVRKTLEPRILAALRSGKRLLAELVDKRAT